MITSRLLAAVDPVKELLGGTIAPPVKDLPTEPTAAISSIIITGIRLALIVAAISMLFYLLWGAYDYINSGGEKEKISSAQTKMTQAAVGMILMIVALTIFVLVTSNILRIIQKDPQGNWIFVIPRVGAQ